MIRNLVSERADRAWNAEKEIMSSWGEEFLILGPVLRIPCQEQAVIKTITETKEEKIEIRRTDFFIYITPEELQGDILLETEVKKRGIFSVPLFSGSVRLTGTFPLWQTLWELKENQRAFPEKAQIIINLASQRGIRRMQKALWNGQEAYFLPDGYKFDGSSAGIYAVVDARLRAENTFDIALDIQGGKSLRMSPLGKHSVFNLKTDWAAPSFQGAYLPVTHFIGDDGFEASWEVSYLSRNIPLAWQGDNKNFSFSSSNFGVNFFKVLDHYDVNMRAVKYAILFIIIPFLAFFIFELFLRRNIHPAQYLLAGTGNVIFYLLLLSLSEHIAFANAYLISALAIVLMTGLYSRSLLGAWNKSWIMGALMAFLYAFLYFTLQSEDWALLIGSIGAFGITALVMFFTRKLDWNGRSSAKKLPEKVFEDKSPLEETVDHQAGKH
jgi:inner membrane protein